MSGRSRRHRRQSQAIADLNLTNLIDVVFALLIIFMISAPMMTQGVQVDLPETESQAVESDATTIQVSIDQDGIIYIDQMQVSLVDFRREFRAVFRDPQMPVFVNADKTVPYGLFVRVISEVQNAGVVKLGFLTTPLTETGGF